MVDVIVNNFNKEIDEDYQFFPEEPSTVAGIGSQFILYAAAVVSKLEVKMLKKFTEETQPTGTFRARLYSSHTGVFRDMDDYAVTLIAESINAVDVDDLTNYGATVEFLFDDVELAAGVYFICLYSSDLIQNDSAIYVLATESASSIVGYVTFWWESENRWGSYVEWD